VKLLYYAETDPLYVEFQERPSVDTREIAADVRLDLDAEGRPVGLDIDHASRVPPSSPSTRSILTGRKARRSGISTVY
jgi:uncharacterized protein YuzE